MHLLLLPVWQLLYFLLRVHNIKIKSSTLGCALLTYIVSIRMRNQECFATPLADLQVPLPISAIHPPANLTPSIGEIE